VDVSQFLEYDFPFCFLLEDPTLPMTRGKMNGLMKPSGSFYLLRDYVVKTMVEPYGFVILPA